MRFGNISAFAVVTVLLSGAAFAQEQSSASAPSSDQQAPSSSQASPPAASRSDAAAASAPSAMSSGVNASGVTTRIITNGPIPDTPENRAAFGKPLSQAGRNSKPAGN